MRALNHAWVAHGAHSSTQLAGVWLPKKMGRFLGIGFCPFWAKRPFWGSFEAGGFTSSLQRAGTSSARLESHEIAELLSEGLPFKRESRRYGEVIQLQAPHPRETLRTAARNACSAETSATEWQQQRGGFQVTKPPAVTSPRDRTELSNFPLAFSRAAR